MGDQIVKAHDGENGDLILSYHQDVEPQLEEAKAARNAICTVEKKSEFRRTMTIPFNVLLEICTKYNLNFYEPEDAKVILKILKGSDYKNFRTVPDKHL